MTLHDLTFGAPYAERIVFLERGTVALDEPPSDVLTPDALRDGYSASITVAVGPDAVPDHRRGAGTTRQLTESG